MAASSYMPPVSIKMTAFDFSKAVISGRDKLCCTTAFFAIVRQIAFLLFTYMLNANFVDFIKI